MTLGMKEGEVKGNPVIYQNWVVYPECCEENLEEVSKNTDNYVIGTNPVQYKNGPICNILDVYYLGGILYMRGKHRIHLTEKASPGLKPEIIRIGAQSILPLICYEILFPEDYLPQSGHLRRPVDLIIHMVGFPMYDINQKEAWVAMQKTLSIMFNCPLVCCCGGEPGEMNISGVVLPGR